MPKAIVKQHWEENSMKHIFSIAFIEKKFEQALINWVKSNGKNSVLIFDESSIKLEGICHINGYGILNTENLIIKWQNISEEKCILYCVELKSEVGARADIIYAQPLKWKDAKLWYAYY